MDQHPAAFNVTQKLDPQTFTLAGALDQTGNVGNYKRF